MSSIATLARALSQAIMVVTLVKILAGFFMEGDGLLVNVNGPSRAEVQGGRGIKHRAGDFLVFSHAKIGRLFLSVGLQGSFSFSGIP